MRTRNRSRAGRMGYETRVNFSRAVGEFAQAFALKEWKYSLNDQKAMVIIRTAKDSGKKEVITFNQAYAELSQWLDKSFANISEDGFSDMLTETFLQNAEVHTSKAVYRLWTREAH